MEYFTHKNVAWPGDCWYSEYASEWQETGPSEEYGDRERILELNAVDRFNQNLAERVQSEGMSATCD